MMAFSRKKMDPMQKTIPRNPKYEDIKSTLDTGASLSKYIQKMEEFRENFKVRDDEIFKRIKMSTFVQLIVQINEVKEQHRPVNSIAEGTNGYRNGKMNGDGAVENTNGSHDPKNGSNPPPTARSTLESLVGGVGEYDTYLMSQFPDRSIQEATPNSMLDGEQPYLLLDVRDRDEYDQCHIITALNYPIAMLSRSVNFETPQMLSYRNKPGRIIIVYDEDERIAPRAASTLVQRGYCNLFLLSGGLKVAWKQFPEGLIIGEMPESLRQLLRPKARERTAGSANRLNSAASSTRSCLSASTLGYTSTIKPRNTTPTIYCTPGSRDMPNGAEDFLAEDIIKLNLQLEKGVGDGRSIQSGYTRSTISSMRHSEYDGRKPFRC